MDKGLVFIELLMVVFIISVLATVAIPAYTDYLLRAQISEGLVLAIPVQKAISDYYAYHGRFPSNNRQANVLEPEQLKGTYVARLEVLEGTIHIAFSGDLSGQVLSLQPQVIADNPLGTMIWQCGTDENIKLKYLPKACRNK
jgi:type IV pilus assembly protein PilA